MQIEHIQNNGIGIAHITAQEPVITDTQSALDLAMSVKYETCASRIAISKDLVCGEFFILSAGVAGEILQKYINYHVKMAIYGDYSRYTSKPLRDFIYESNQGKDFFFVATREIALEKLAQAK